MAVKIQIRRDTESNWSSNNPTLSLGEVGFVTDLYKVKIGDGTTLWNSLDYFADVLSASSSLVDYVNEKIADVIDLSPETLDTLNELAAAINDDPDFFLTIVNTISSASAQSISDANDYTDGEITTLTGVIASASAQSITDANNYTDSEVSSAIVTASAAAVTYLVDGAPEALNTLNELAAALNDNEDILDTLLTTSSASTIYAPIDSPTFTGTVDFTSASVVGIDALPDQTGNDGKYLTTDGSTASWETVEGGGGGTASDDTIFKAQLFFGGSN
jgi:hypothetical protein